MSSVEIEKIITEALAALSEILAGVPQKTRERIVRNVVKRIEHEEAGDAAKALKHAEIVASDIARAQRVALAVARKRGLRIAWTIGRVIANAVGGPYGVLIGGIIAMLETSEE